MIRLMVIALLMGSSAANAAEVYGRVQADYADSSFVPDRATLGVNHSFDDTYSAVVAVDGANGLVELSRAMLSAKGLPLSGVLTAGMQRPVYSAHLEGPSTWVRTAFVESVKLMPEHDYAWSYTGEVSGVGFALEARDGVKGDKKDIYAGHLSYSVVPAVHLVLGYQHDVAAEDTLTHGALKASYSGLSLLAECAQQHAKDSAIKDRSSQSVVATYDMTEAWALYASHVWGNDAFQGVVGYESDSHAGILHPLNKSINVAGLYNTKKLLTETDSGVSLRLAATF